VVKDEGEGDVLFSKNYHKNGSISTKKMILPNNDDMANSLGFPGGFHLFSYRCTILLVCYHILG